MDMEDRTRRGRSTEDRGRTTSWPRTSRRSMDIRRHGFEAVNRNSVLAVAKLEGEKGG